jgi:hypothetical protein
LPWQLSPALVRLKRSTTAAVVAVVELILAVVMAAVGTSAEAVVAGAGAALAMALLTAPIREITTAAMATATGVCLSIGSDIAAFVGFVTRHASFLLVPGVLTASGGFASSRDLLFCHIRDRYPGNKYPDAQF